MWNVTVVKCQCQNELPVRMFSAMTLTCTSSECLEVYMISAVTWATSPMNTGYRNSVFSTRTRAAKQRSWRGFKSHKYQKPATSSVLINPVNRSLVCCCNFVLAKSTFYLLCTVFTLIGLMICTTVQAEKVQLVPDDLRQRQRGRRKEKKSLIKSNCKVKRREQMEE